MHKINFDRDEIRKLDYMRYNHPHPMVQKRCEALWLRANGFKQREILKICNIVSPTYCHYVNLYIAGGIESLKQLNYKKHTSKLYDHKESIEEHLKMNPPHTISEAGEMIYQLTGIRRSNTQIRYFLLECGLRFRKAGVIPGKADIESQEQFIREEIEPRLQEASEGKRAVFFADSAHFVMGVFLGYLWSCVRLFVKSSSGRSRYNVLGAIDVVTKQLVKITNDSYINAVSVCELLQEISNLKLAVPITIILDNARYQKCKMVKELAVSLNIELLYLPPYSPNLNLIERLWKFVKKKCLYSHYYEDFTAFKAGIENCLNKTAQEYKAELDKLLSPKFQTFKNTNLLH